ncbi:FAD-binding oxidoreductase [Modestobacter italicus]|uniref:FAD-binding oxidoreductase n=1 Tax=Modestobacter italicus (strain DSM 44449 / CECT 9708 / BC 501) TaxID=2732864 RepID=UPI001C987648|nr:FAD-dependent oxidoreductase [Modestobacter italicus]
MTATTTELTGTVHRPGDPGYATAVGGFNLTVVHQPAVVVEARSPADVAAAVRYAARASLRVTVQNTGHGARRPAGPDTLLLRTGALDSVSLDPAGRTATLGAGVTAGPLIAAAAEHGLAPVTGAAPSVGLVGLSAGGGIGPLARALGFAADRVRSLEVVTADGEQRHVDGATEPDLFFALRGGGGGVAVVTSMTVELVELAGFWGGAVFFPGADAAAVLHAWRSWAPTLPPEVTTSIALLRLPPLPQLPEPLRGQFVVHLRIASTGSPEEGAALLAPMLRVAEPLLDTVASLPCTALASVHMDPTDPAPVTEAGCLLGEFTAEAADALLAEAGPGTQTPLVLAEVRALGGAMATEPAVPNAVGGRDARWSLYTVGFAAPPVAGAASAAALGLVEAMRPWRSGVQYNLAGGRDLVEAWPADVLARLQQITRDRDPQRLLAPAQPVPLP